MAKNTVAQKGKFSRCVVGVKRGVVWLKFEWDGLWWYIISYSTSNYKKNGLVSACEIVFGGQIRQICQ